jgi:hypothetical protein
MRGIRRAVVTMSLGLFACAEHGETPSVKVEARDLVLVDVVGHPGGMYAFSCPWFPDSAEFVNLSSRRILVRTIELSLRHSQGARHTKATAVAQPVTVDVTLAPYARGRVEFYEPTPDGRGRQNSVRLQGCTVTEPPRISEAEFVE